VKHTSHSQEETKQLAQALLKHYPDHKIWLLYGNLASGKTTFTKGLAEALGLPAKGIKSPTFTFVTEYDSLIHYDLYRLESMDEMLAQLLEEHLSEDKHILIEWPELIEPQVHRDHLKIKFRHEGDDQRSITVLPS
jgi:tRNA threonylcarbamoyladenosine biosynthesis protein TsaE